MCDAARACSARVEYIYIHACTCALRRRRQNFVVVYRLRRRRPPACCVRNISSPIVLGFRCAQVYMLLFPSRERSRFVWCASARVPFRSMPLFFSLSLSHVLYTYSFTLCGERACGHLKFEICLIFIRGGVATCLNFAPAVSLCRARGVKFFCKAVGFRSGYVCGEWKGNNIACALAFFFDAFCMGGMWNGCICRRETGWLLKNS